MSDTKGDSFVEELERAYAPIRAQAKDRLHIEAQDAAPGDERLSMTWRYLVPTLILIVVGFAVWAAIQPVWMSIPASGEVASSGPGFSLRLPGGAKITEMLVAEGQTVSPGEPILRVDGAIVTDALERAETDLIRLQLEAERLKALIESRPPDFSEIAAGYPAELSAWVTKWRESWEKHLAAQSALDGEVEQMRRDEARMKEALALAKRQARLAADQEAIREAAAKSGVVSREVYLETAQARVAADSAVADVRDKSEAASEALERALSQRKAADEKRIGQLQSQLREIAQSQVAMVQDVFTLQELAQTRTLKAPRGGRIKGIADVVSLRQAAPGAVALRIENSGALNVEIKLIVPARDIGRVMSGQAVGVRLQGALPWQPDLAQGKIISVATGYVLDEATKTPLYSATVRLESGGEDMLPLLVPGVAVAARIQVEQKPLWQLLLGPRLSADLLELLGNRPGP